jgi:hypothetical protein
LRLIKQSFLIIFGIINAKWTDISASGTFGGISVAAEHLKQKAVGINAEEKVTLLHVGGKVGTVK